ncbi:MAG: Rha family transcriptional regulator [Clostridiales bacterium]|nr:Rha family transcriptional regulator [Clostridiales bacterium]
MKELIKKDEYGVFADGKETARADSLFVAKFFEKEHKNVLRDIENLIDPESGLSEEFNRLNFEPTSYVDGWNRKQKAYAMTRDGFTMLVMSYTGAKANRFKELYIKRFNEMESHIKALSEAKADFPLLTDNIKLLYENPQPYHYSNECNLVNKVALGMTAKKYRELNGIPKGETIRPYLTEEQLYLLNELQKADVTLLRLFSDYNDRKEYLKQYKDRLLLEQNRLTA